MFSYRDYSFKYIKYKLSIPYVFFQCSFMTFHIFDSTEYQIITEKIKIFVNINYPERLNYMILRQLC